MSSVFNIITLVIIFVNSRGLWDSLVAQLVKNPPAMQETRLILRLGRFPGEGIGYPFQYSGLENSMDCIVHGVAKSQTPLSDFHFLYQLNYQGIPISPISAQFSSVAQLCPTLCDPMGCSTPGLPVHHQPPEFTQTHVH